MKLSLAIPTWEYYGRGVEFLDDLLRTISIQTFRDFEVVISDHSQNNDIRDFCEENIYNLLIRYNRCLENRGNGPYNTNNAISLCEGDIIKVMFQDDFFYDDEAFEKIIDEFEKDNSWLLCGCNHTADDGNSFYMEMYPRWNNNILLGVNTISSPSVLAFRRSLFEQVKFDANLKMMMDCDFYYHAMLKFGNPIYLDDVLVSNRVHENQISSNYRGNINEEIQYCYRKYHA